MDDLEPGLFTRILAGLAREEDAACVLTRDLRFVRVNPAWTRFAGANGGDAAAATWRRGADLLAVITPALRPFYRTLFDRVRATGGRAEHDYECSSAELFRTFRMLIVPVEPDFFVVAHALRVERPHDRRGQPVDDAFYRDDGIIHMCAGCRRVRPRGATARWDWVPDYVAQPPATVSHGLCTPCAIWYETAASATA